MTVHTNSTTDTGLDRVVWTALTTRQSSFAMGEGLARRFDPEVSPFAATPDASPESLRALGELLLGETDQVFLLQAADVVVPEGLLIVVERQGVQMVKRRPMSVEEDAEDIVSLTEGDIPEMIALAELTKPGPFGPRTSELGAFWGIKRDSRLIAMAGRRLAIPGFTEVSGVCTHPDYRGQGLAAKLSAYATARIEADGITPFLHAYADNKGAIRLYQKLGYDVRCHVNAAIIKRRSS